MTHNFARTVTQRGLVRMYRLIMRPGSHWAWLSLAMYAMAAYLPGDYGVHGSYFGVWTAWDKFADRAKELVAWWANPIYFTSLVLNFMGRCRTSIVFALMAVASAYVVAALQVSFRYRVPSGGHLLWLASTQVLVCNSAWEAWLAFKKRTDQRELDFATSEATSSMPGVGRSEQFNLTTRSLATFLRSVHRFMVPP